MGAICPPRCIVLFVVGLLVCVVGIFAIFENERYSPVYDDVVCKPVETRVSQVSVTPSIRLTLDCDIMCWNPNPYDIVILPNGAGRGYIGDEMLEVGEVASLPATVPARPEKGQYSRQTIVIRGVASLTFMQMFSVASTLLAGPFNLFFELKLKVMVAPTFFGASPHTEQIDVQQKCGLKVQLLPAAIGGPAVCTDADFRMLEVPPFDDAEDEVFGPLPPEGGMRPEVPQEMRDDAQQSVGVLCIVLAVITFAIGLPCVITPPIRAACAWRASRKTVVAKVASSVQPEAVGRKA